MLLALGLLLALWELRTRCVCDSILTSLSCTIEEVAQDDDRLGDENNGLVGEVAIEVVPPPYVRQRAYRRCCDCGGRPNRQEALFPCGRCGAGMLMFQFQFVLNVCLLSIIALGMHEAHEVYVADYWVYYALLVLDFLVFIYAGFYISLVCIRKHMIITNVLFADDR